MSSWVAPPRRHAADEVERLREALHATEDERADLHEALVTCAAVCGVLARLVPPAPLRSAGGASGHRVAPVGPRSTRRRG